VLSAISLGKKEADSDGEISESILKLTPWVLESLTKQSSNPNSKLIQEDKEFEFSKKCIELVVRQNDNEYQDRVV